MREREREDMATQQQVCITITKQIATVGTTWLNESSYTVT